MKLKSNTKKGTRQMINMSRHWMISNWTSLSLSHTHIHPPPLISWPRAAIRPAAQPMTTLSGPLTQISPFNWSRTIHLPQHFCPALTLPCLLQHVLPLCSLVLQFNKRSSTSSRLTSSKIKASCHVYFLQLATRLFLVLPFSSLLLFLTCIASTLAIWK